MGGKSSRGRSAEESGPGRKAWGVEDRLTPGLCPGSYYNTTSVLLCLSITALVCLSVTIFSFQTKVSSGAGGRQMGWGGLHAQSPIC